MGRQHTLLRSLHERIMSLDGETPKVLRMVGSASAVSGKRVLDVGCGYGRFLGGLHASGFDVTGVDVNPEIVAANRRQGLRCLAPDELKSGEYDVLLMSHVIEHFAPDDLLVFMDRYLDRLRPGGHLVIATPLMSDYFYDDFDHIRPYQPAGILAVFGPAGAQIQYQSRNKIALRDLWFRRSPKRLSYARARYLGGIGAWLLFALDLLASAAFLATARRFGTVNGWVAVFEKTRP